MLIYTTPAAAAFFCTLGRGRIPLAILALYLALIVGFGYGVGADYFAYVDIQAAAPSLASESFWPEFVGYYEQHGVEIIYAIANVILATLGLDPQSIFILMAGLSSYFIYKISTRFPMPSACLVFVACYVLAFSGIWNQIRYGLSILMAAYACVIFCEGRRKAAFVMLAFAAGIHVIAIVMCFVLVFYRLFSQSRLSLTLLSFAVVVLSVLLSIIDVQAILRSILMLINDRYSAYTDSGGSQLNFIIRLGFFSFIFFLLSKTEIRKDAYMSALFVLMLCSLLVWSVAWRIDVLYRIGVMFDFGYLLLFIRQAYFKSTYYYMGLASIATLLSWRLFKGVGVLNDYNSFLFLTVVG